MSSDFADKGLDWLSGLLSGKAGDVVKAKKERRGKIDDSVDKATKSNSRKSKSDALSKYSVDDLQKIANQTKKKSA